MPKVVHTVQNMMAEKFGPEARILVAVSGGADSTALLLALHQVSAAQGWSLAVAHLNHGLRESATRETEAVAQLAKRLALPFFTETTDVRKMMRQHALSLEMAARQARYAFLKRQALAWKADAVALGHTQNDQAETVLLRLLRGAGRTGLSGMAADTRREGMRWVRPLLTLPRHELETWLSDQHVVWSEDASNDDPAMLRNRVRHEVLPLLKERFNPRIVDTLARNAALLAEEETLLCSLATAAQKSVCTPEGLRTPELREHPLPLARRIILNCLLELGLPDEAVDAAMVQRVLNLAAHSHGTATCSLADGWVAVRRYELLTFEGPHSESAPTKFCLRLELPGDTPIPGTPFLMRATAGRGPWRPGPEGPPCVALPKDRLAGATLRNRTPGLRIRLQGLNGSRKVQDLLTEAKIPQPERDAYPLLFNQEVLVWVPGFRPAAGWCVNEPNEEAWHIAMIRTPEQ